MPSKAHSGAAPGTTEKKLGVSMDVWREAAFSPKPDLRADQLDEAVAIMTKTKQSVPHLEVPIEKRLTCWACRFLVPNKSAVEIMLAVGTPGKKELRQSKGKVDSGCMSCGVPLCRQSYVAFHMVPLEPYGSQ